MAFARHQESDSSLSSICVGGLDSPNDRQVMDLEMVGRFDILPWRSAVNEIANCVQDLDHGTWGMEDQQIRPPS